MFTIDNSTEFGARIERQLNDELVIWLTTVGKSGTPQPNPVWFSWNGAEILVFSQPGKAKSLRTPMPGRGVTSMFTPQP